MKKTWIKPNNIVQARIKAGLSQKEAAERLNILQASLSRAESGRNVSPEMLQRMAQLYGVSWIDFLCDPAEEGIKA